MGPCKLGRHAKEALALMEAEDRALKQLETLPSRVAAAAAVKAASVLTAEWELRKWDLVRRNDRGRVYCSTARRLGWLTAATAKYSTDPTWGSCRAELVIDQLSGLSPDAAALIAYNVAQWMCRKDDLIR
jgi:hypothetical protein